MAQRKATVYYGPMILKDRTIVITGASRGLGKALAEALAKKSVKLVIAARNSDQLNKVAATTGSFAMVCDVTKEKDVQKVAEEAVKKHGRIDIWINNAGIWMPKTPIENISPDRAHELFNTNFFGTFYGAQAAAKIMRKQREGTIVNVVSSSVWLGHPLISAYTSSKWAVRGLTDSLREELKASSISVIGVYPGKMKTHIFDEKMPADYEEYMTPESVADRIIANLEKDQPEQELIIKNPNL